MLSICVHMFETKMYFTPEEKHRLVKLMGFGVFLMDTEACNINKLDQKKKNYDLIGLAHLKKS